MAEKWSQEVTEHSDALDLEERVFEKDDPKEIAKSLKRSAERSKRRKGTPLQSAMGILTFYQSRRHQSRQGGESEAGEGKGCASCAVREGRLKLPPPGIPKLNGIRLGRVAAFHFAVPKAASGPAFANRK